MARLEELFDAGTGGRCIKWRHYFEIYERYLGKFVGTDVRYLEIGVQMGGSLHLMRRYLGEQATIIGVDVNPNCAILAREGLEVHIGSGDDAQFLGHLARERGPFDVIIDDGGHVPDQQLVSFLTLFPSLKEGGIYLVEDLHASFWQEFQNSRYGINFYDFAKGLVEKLSYYHIDHRFHEEFKKPYDQRVHPQKADNFAANEIFGVHFYDSIVVIEKRRRQEPSSEQK
jgi:hypothetical protein